MSQVTNSMPIWDVTWRKSSYSNPYGNCVELAPLVTGLVAVRHSQDPGGPTQIFPRAAIDAFIHAAKGDEFGQKVR